jgi:hypoxia up-regulated 1
MIDDSMYGLMMDLDGPDIVKDASTSQLLVPQLKKVTYQGKY